MWLHIRMFMICGYVLVLACSCNKPDDTNITRETKVDSISGILYNDCNLVPEINRQLIVKPMIFDYDVVYEVGSDTIYTDSMGRFSIHHTFDYYAGQEVYFTVIIPGSCALDWPSASITPYHPFILNDTAHVVLKLQVSNLLTTSDTLCYKFSGDTIHSLPGPFINGVIGNYEVPRQWFANWIDSSYINLNYALGMQDLIHFGATWDHISFPHLTCTASDTITIILN